jgi:TonB family protein
MLWGRSFHVNLSVAAVIYFGLIGFSSAVRAEGQPGRVLGHATWSSKMTELLKLNATQQSALKDYLATIPDSSKYPTMDDEQRRAMTMPQRLDFVSDRIAFDLPIARSEAAAAHRFYDLLSVEQRKIFDNTTMLSVEHARLGFEAGSLSLPGAPNYEFPSHTNPSWLVKPTGEELSRVYPTVAQRNHTTGKVSMTCAVDNEGYLTDCVIVSEVPKDQGFGNAALEMSAYMRMNPATNYGVPTPANVTVPLNFTP